jgi:hypothetical protein
MNKLFIREDYEHGFIAQLRNRDGKLIQEIKTRSIKYLQLTARSTKATIFPKRFRL